MKEDLEANEPQIPDEEEASDLDGNWTVLESERTKNAPYPLNGWPKSNLSC